MKTLFERLKPEWKLRIDEIEQQWSKTQMHSVINDLSNNTQTVTCSYGTILCLADLCYGKFNCSFEEINSLFTKD